MNKKIKIIAHGANSLEKIKAAFAAGADLAEVDVSKQVFTNRFIAQHQGVLGKFGIGPNLANILTKIAQDKIFFDLKHPQFTPTIAAKFDELLKKFNFKLANIASDNFEVLEKLAGCGDYNIYFLVENERNLQSLLILKSRWSGKKFGATIAVKFLDQVDLPKLAKNNLQIFAGPINDVGELQKAVRFGVEGIITDEVAKMTKALMAFTE